MLLIKGGKILIGKFWRRANILVNEQGLIVKIFRSEKINQFFASKVDTIYKAEGCLLLPGIVDMHVHFREPGFEYKEDFETGSKAAIAGGTTVVADMPNNKPRIKSLELLKKKKDRVEKKSYTDFLLYLEIPNDPTELNQLKQSDILPAGIKVYYYIEDEARAFLQYPKPNEVLYIVHAEDSLFIKKGESCATYEDFESMRPKKAEIEAVKKALKLAENGLRIHITHVSTLESLLEIINAKKRGLPVSMDVTIHHLLLTKKDGEKLKSIAKCFPPLRDEIDRRSLVNGLSQGYIDAITTDHAPHSPEEKMMDLCNAPAGIASIQYTLPLLFTFAKKIHVKDLGIIIKALSERPARILSIRNRGKIKPGYYADIIVFNHRRRWKILGEDGFSKAKLTPWEKMEVHGDVEATFLRGQLVYEGGEILKRVGKFLQPSV